MSTELEPRSTPDEAQRRADRIRGHIASAWEEVITAFKRRDFETLGYGSGQAGWDAYILGEYGESRLMLPRAERVQKVIEASQAGMSNRAIASAAGISDGTVRNDLQAGAQFYAPVRNLTPASASSPESSIAVTPTQVTGMDGKTYPRTWPEPAPEKPRRTPLPRTYTSAVLDVQRRLTTLRDLTRDDRWPANKNQVATMHGSDLERINDLLQQVRQSLK